MKVLLAFTAIALATSPALAAPCRDAKGKFTKCPTAATGAALPAGVTKDAKGHCHGAGGKFVTCPK